MYLSKIHEGNIFSKCKTFHGFTISCSQKGESTVLKL